MLRQVSRFCTLGSSGSSEVVRTGVSKHYFYLPFIYTQCAHSHTCRYWHTPTLLCGVELIELSAGDHLVDTVHLLTGVATVDSKMSQDPERHEMFWRPT